MNKEKVTPSVAISSRQLPLLGEPSLAFPTGGGRRDGDGEYSPFPLPHRGGARDFLLQAEDFGGHLHLVGGLGHEGGPVAGGLAPLVRKALVQQVAEAEDVAAVLFHRLADGAFDLPPEEGGGLRRFFRTVRRDGRVNLEAAVRLTPRDPAAK